jgi:thiol-disulfide isomerase/thioredoxin
MRTRISIAHSALAALATLVAVAALAGCAQKKIPAQAPAEKTILQPDKISSLLQEIGMQVPKEPLAATDFTLESLDGKTSSLGSHKGKFVFLNFWATWCPPCRSEMPAMQALYEKLQARGLVILAVDLAEEPAVVRDYMKQNKLTFPVLLDKTGEVGGIYGAQSIPTTYLIDRAGNVLGRGVGARWTWDSPEIVALFEKLL